MSPASTDRKRAVVVGAGPAGLMAAEVMAKAGLAVTVCDHKPSVGRKFLMAGKSGLNLTKAEHHRAFLEAYAEAGPHLRPMIESFDSDAVQDWATGLGQTLFTGSTGRVFPTVMKASPLLRAWLARLSGADVKIRTQWRWAGWSDGALVFETPDGVERMTPDVTVLAMGGASWARLGSTGEWAEILARHDVALAPFAAANAGLCIDWSDYMKPFFGTALKPIGLNAGAHQSRGEAVISSQGLEGGGVYTVSRGVREGHALFLDLLPDQSADMIAARLDHQRGKASLANHLRKALKLDAVKIALLQEMARPLPQDGRSLAGLIKAVPMRHQGLRPMDEAISTAGGVRFDAVDAALMLRNRPGVFVAGEMLDWEAPTGGYLLSACLATGRWAGQHAAAWAKNT